MAHGQPDFGGHSTQTIVGSLGDMAELAARLGSVVTFDRRGNVIWIDEFEDNIKKWKLTTTGTGASIALSGEKPKNGGFSAKFITPSDSPLSVQMTRAFPFPQVSKVGVEVSFTLDDDLTYFHLELDYRTATLRSQAILYFNHSEGKLYYYDDGGSPVELQDGINFPSTTPHYHTLKLVIDLETQKYVRALLDNYSFDLADIACITTGGSYTYYFYSLVKAGGSSGNNVPCYVDDFILTQNEP